MRKGLLGFIFGVGFLTLFGGNAFSQDKDKGPIPGLVMKELDKYVVGVSYCDTSDFTINFLGKKLKDKDGDGIKDKVIMYNVEENVSKCYTIASNYFRFTYKGKGEGSFSDVYKCETFDLRDMNGKTVPLTEEDW